MRDRAARAAVITATLGTVHLRDCAESVARQTYGDLEHIVVIDGPIDEPARGRVSEVHRAFGVTLVALPMNTGRGQMYGHRIYGAMTYLVEADVCFWLDEDNMFLPDHVESSMTALRTTGADWCYGLRSICSTTGAYVCEDDCDSLGAWPRYGLGYVGTGVMPVEQERFLTRWPYLVDTNCYAVRTGVANRIAPLWMHAGGADSIVATHLVRRYRTCLTGRSGVMYRLRSGTLTEEFLLAGNKLLDECYPNGLPWRSGHPLLVEGAQWHPFPRRR